MSADASPHPPSPDHDSHHHIDGVCQGHSHGLTQTAALSGVSDSRLLWCVGLNHVLTVGQVVAGVWSGSVALLSDAAHNFNDANALLIAYIARRISRRDANDRYTFGYRRAELIGATINLTLLAAVGLYLIFEAVHRFIWPSEIIGELMAAAAVLAIIVDVATAALLWSMSAGSLNVRAAFQHNLTDALGSLAVLIGAGGVIYLDWAWIDPLLTLMIAGYVLWLVARLLPQAVQILMEGVPVGVEIADIISRVESVHDVENVHHVHVWQLDEQHRAMEAHVVIDPSRSASLETIKRAVKELLENEFRIRHSTLEFEFTGTCAPDNGSPDCGTC